MYWFLLVPENKIPLIVKAQKSKQDIRIYLAVSIIQATSV